MIPNIMFLYISVFLLIIMVTIELLDKYNRLTEKVKGKLELLMIGSLAFWLISFSAIAGPDFFRSMDYNVTNVDNTITAFDATNCVMNSLFTVVIGYFFLKLSRK